MTAGQKQQFIVDEDGKRVAVILPIDDYEQLVERARSRFGSPQEYRPRATQLADRIRALPEFEFIRGASDAEPEEGWLMRLMVDADVAVVHLEDAEMVFSDCAGELGVSPVTLKHSMWTYVATHGSAG